MADGVGGSAYGEVASQLAVDASMDYLAAETQSLANNPAGELANAIKIANEEIITIQRNEPKYENMSATLTCVYLTATTLHYAWVGDSRVYLLRPASDSVDLLTADHTLDQSKIDPELAPGLYRRAPNILTKMVGSILLLKPETGSIGVKSGDLVLACTDGLSNLVDDTRMLDYACAANLNTPEGLDNLADKLLDRALDCGGQDNISLILARVD